MNKIFLLSLCLILVACSYVGEIKSKKNVIDFDSLYYNGKVYSIGDKYSEINFSSKDNLMNYMGSCTTIFNPDLAISYTFHSKKLVEILIKYGNKSVHTSKGISNGMTAENINNNYKAGYKVIKIKSEGAGDYQQDFNYQVFDSGQKNNILFFDVVNREIQGIHLQEKDFSISDCEE
ncbi:hypothetical protein A7P54_11340 [Acinetobacter sp. Ac_3412]|uniref:hypothetical protein n=1 Tax=Acinetobacter sp. Ac_3412 TaxID=1848935 RepID=UPI00148FEB31|nr:hypothetical protein [Acinetobacter sp. Ac_3412]NNP77009.1 hypothetical protein [Acinetobacter sp. Ac_3412]